MSPNLQTELTEAQRGAILILRKEGYNYREIADAVKVSVGAAYNTVQRVVKYGQMKSLPRSGRPSSVSDTTRREIIRALRRNRFDTYKSISEQLGYVNKRMVRKVAYDAGYRRRVARRKPFITAATQAKRLAWARTNKNTNWEGIGWTDEAHIETGERPSHPRVTRKPDEAHLTECVAPTFRSGRDSISVWSCIAIDYKGPLIRLETAPITVNAKGRKQGGGLTAQGYIDQVLSGPLPKFLKKVSKEKGLEMRVVEDGAAAHRAKVTQAAREKLGIEQLPHPPSSPDLNPIEPLWLLLKNRVAKIKGSSNSAEKLWEAAQQAWESITIKEVNMYAKNMPARVQAVLKAKGGHTAF
ncbi:DDE superfamily endonuclease, partial [Rhizoctonia solani]